MHSTIKKKLFAFVILIGIGVFLAGCHQNEKTRIHIQKVGSFTGELAHEGGEIGIWTDFDIEYFGDVSAEYQVTFSQGGEVQQTVTCNPFDVTEKRMERSVDARNISKLSYYAWMDCSVTLPEGKYTVNVEFTGEGNKLRIFRADLILK